MDDPDPRLLATFRAEAEEHQRALTASLLALDGGLEGDAERDAIQSTFRAMHTLKGAARAVGVLEIEAVCQAAELLLSRVVRSDAALRGEHVALLQDTVAAVGRLLEGDMSGRRDTELIARLEAAAASVPAGPAPASRRPPARQPRPEPAAISDLSVRIDTAKLDRLLVQAEELLVAKLHVEARSNEAAALAVAMSRARRDAVRNNGDGGIDLRAEEAAARGLAERLKHDRHAIGPAVDRLLADARAARMMPVARVLDAVPGMVADLARSAGKTVEWVATGTELEVDRRVLERIKDPLIHLIRNAIDHGIEPPAARAAAGKPERGRVAVAVTARPDGRVEIDVEDDGRGMSADRLRTAAQRTGHLPDGGDDGELGRDALIDLAFSPGVTTSPGITDVSGHGLGLAIVREQVEQLEGAIRVHTGRDGTRVSMVLPASVATFRGVLVRCAGQAFLLPIRSVEHVVAARPSGLSWADGHAALPWRDQLVPAATLDAVLGLDRAPGDAPPDEQAACVLSGTGPQRAAVLVDEVCGDCEVVVKDLAPPLLRVPHVAGVGVLGGGDAVLILRSGDLVRAAQGAARPATANAPAGRTTMRRAARVLVVDDAVTTRTMERGILEAAGYHVRTAVDGDDAWAALRKERFDAVVSDIDMPGLDGFELTERIRSEPAMADLPVVLVSALESPGIQERGLEAGASAYLPKASFDRSNLLDVVRGLGVPPELEAAS